MSDVSLHNGMVSVFTIPGYNLIEMLYEGTNTVVYRGRIAKETATPIILKILKAEYPSLEQITRLKHEYKVAANLDLDGVVKVYQLESWHNRLGLVCEDFGGESLKNWIEKTGRLSLVSFLKIAVQLAKSLAALHQHQIIHKDIKPANIIINGHGLVKLTDFSIASCLSQELQTSNLHHLEGTLAYMSPEQTGRMNRSLDYRSDFYSLGVTFYELLTGQLPFQGTDPLVLVHGHIAKQPTPIQQLAAIPDAIAAIVTKLMAKNAEDRYQSAIGLLQDLESCLVQIEATGTIAADFVSGRLDVLSQLLIPQKLYGRDQQVNQLLEAFERVSQGTSELMLVSGYSGIGKSSVVNEVHKPVTRQRGYFIAGKFDQFKRNIPYVAVIQAFGSLMRQLLSESQAELQCWKEKLLSALSANGQVVIDVIPEVELIIGKQPDVPQLAPTEAQNRFNRVFQDFIHVFAQKAHPLVVFLDDLQWADSATLNLMQLLINQAEQSLLLIGAYRDNEVGLSHPLTQVIAELKRSGTVSQLVLEPLNQTSVVQLVADTLHQSNVEPLAELLWHKTGGNPFFLTQLLQVLYQSNLVQFEFEQAEWKWNLLEIQALGITDKSVVELVAARLRKLPINTQNILKLAACIGDKFSLEAMSIVSQADSSKVAQALYPALQVGFILPLNQSYKIPLVIEDSELQSKIQTLSSIGYRFLHDRVQQAAYSLISEEQKQTTHLSIGQLLLHNTPEHNLEANIFDIVNQLNVGLDRLHDQSEKDQLARLNLIAGKKAKAATAYETAANYLNIGLQLLSENSWCEQYDFTLQLHTEALEAEFLNTNLTQAEQLVEIALKHAKTLLDTVKIYEIEIQSYAAQNQMLSAIDTTLKVLELLGVTLVHEAPMIPDPQQVLNLPEMTDPYRLAAMRLLVNVYAPAIVAAPDLLTKLVFTAVTLCLQDGNSAMAAVGYVFYGVVLSTQFNNIDAGYQFGKLAVNLLQKFDSRTVECAVYTEFNLLLRHWKEPISATIQPVLSAMQTGLETGDVFYASCCAKDGCTNLFLMGEPLGAVEQQQARALDLLLKLKQQYSIYYAGIWKQLVLNLMGRSQNPLQLVGESFDEVALLPRILNEKTQTLILVFYLAKAILLYLLGDLAGAKQNIQTAGDYIEASAGMTILPAYHFYNALILIDATQNFNLDAIAQSQAKLRQWTDHAPMNFQHKYDLIEAERHRLLSQPYQAMEYYDRAISGALENGYLSEAAIANERAAKFYAAIDKHRVAQGYMTEAYYLYIRWGAIAKVQQLEDHYSHLILQSRYDTALIHTDTVQASLSRPASTTTNRDLLDLATVMKAAQAISSDIVLERLLANLLHITLENAAAQKGCLILEREGQLFIEAADLEQDNAAVSVESYALQESRDVPASLIQYVARTQQTLVLNNAAEESLFQSDPYIQAQQPKSVLCAPILYQGCFIGVLYLENNLAIGGFTQDRLELLKLLTAQAAIAIKNAQLYVREQENAQKLQDSLQQLQQAQLQLIQTEKMATLGNLVAGIAHEINNPLGFLNGSLTNMDEAIQDLLAHLQCYQHCYPEPLPAIQESAEAISIEYLTADLPKLVNTMRIAIDRIKTISTSLRTFSRSDTDQKVACNIHDGIDSTLLILKYRLQANSFRSAIAIQQSYSDLPLVECFPGRLNQVFMNLLANAIDAIDEAIEIGINVQTTPPQITIQTEAVDNAIVIRIRDSGGGMSEEVKAKIFTHLFTTKGVNKGTGLGLSISRQIVEEIHQGTLSFTSTAGVGTEFEILIPV